MEGSYITVLITYTATLLAILMLQRSHHLGTEVKGVRDVSIRSVPHVEKVDQYLSYREPINGIWLTPSFEF